MAVYTDKHMVKLESKKEALQLHMLIQSFYKGYNLSKADIQTLIELDDMGYTSEFFDSCISKGFFRTKQSIRNAIARMDHLGLVITEKRGDRKVNSALFPVVEQEKILLQYVVGNL